MTTLSDEIKTFIVIALASFDSPSEIVDAVKANFDVEISRQQVHSYDPRCLQPPAQRWRDLHAATRRAFLDETAKIGIAHKARRLRLLERLVDFTMSRNWIDDTAALLEQAAKECGGMYDRPMPTPAPVSPPAPAATVDRAGPAG